MGKLGEEVSQKIKSAIKAKLMELGIHIDNELPDYVMVLVANKKTQQQMEDDLSLFLGDSTRAFTSWLHNVLKKLEQVTISTKAKKKDKLRKRGVDYDSNGVSSTKKFKTEHEEIKTEPTEIAAPETAELEVTLKTVASSVTEDTENDDALSLTDHTEVRNEPESTSEETHKEGSKKDEEALEEMRPRERIKIVWDKDGESSRERVNRTSKDRDRSKRMDRGRDKDRQSRSRSRSPSRNRHSNRKKLRGSEEESTDRSRQRSRSRDRFNRKQSTSPKRQSSGDGKVVDARDILKRRGADKKLAESKARRLERSPYRRRNRSRSREPRENKMSSVLKAVIRAPEKPLPTIPSMVKVTPRPVRPPSMQPNCNLILKAVADAERSLATSKVHSKKKEEYEEKKRKRERKRYDYAAKGNISITLLNDRVVASKLGVPSDAYPKDEIEFEGTDIENNENHTSQETTVEEDTLSMALDADDFIDSFDKEDQYVAEPQVPPVEEYKPTPKGKDKVDKKNRFIISLDSTASDNEADNDMDNPQSNCEISDDVTSTTVEPVLEEKPEKRQFDRSRLGPKVQLSPTTSPAGKKSAIPDTLAELTSSLTRCKYWPNCDAGDGCPYVHPSSLCRSFPSCHFGDKCVYIHPACKFADNCLNAKCPYTHTSKTPVAKAPRPYLPISNPQVICMYYRNCTKPYCPYLHTKKPCRFGASCTKLGCDFDHGNNNRNPYKWVATNQI